MNTRPVRTGRVYGDPSPEDGCRVLVDRIWPRGLSRQRASIDEWCKEVAPSTELRQWYGHDPARYEEFARRYRSELAGPEQSAAVAHLSRLADAGPLTLLTATRQCEISQAAVLAHLLSEAPGG